MSAPACRSRHTFRRVSACVALALAPMAAVPLACAQAPASAEAPAPPPADVPPPDDGTIDRSIPLAEPIKPVVPTIDPRQVPPPSPLLKNEVLPVPDRWRLLDQLKLVNPRWYDPYNPNTFKGDRPVFGDDWFFNFTGISDSLFEARRLPTPVGAQSSDRPQSNDTLGRYSQYSFDQNIILSFSLLKGSTAFKPPEIEFRFVPVLNYNYTHAQEVRVLNVDPRTGHHAQRPFRRDSRKRSSTKHRATCRSASTSTSIRVGIQPFTSDFRGFLFQDEPVGVRLFGNARRAIASSTTSRGSAASRRTPTAA